MNELVDKVMDEFRSRETFSFEMNKESAKTLNDDKIREQLDYIKGRINSAGRSGKWTITYTYSSVLNNIARIRTYNAVFTLVPTEKNKNVDVEFKAACEIARSAGSTPKWLMVKAGDEVLVDADKDSVTIEIPSDWYEQYFGHIYGRRDQIDIVMSAVEAGMASNFENRFNCVLFGPPACGKSEITQSFKSLFGDEACIEYDATSTTQAGALKDLKEREKMPRLLIIEEMEKVDESALRWLLSVLDHRAEIRKTNYRESFQKEVKLLCIATVNDYELFKKMMYGALHSRFTHKIYCPRPNEEVLTMILQREIKKLGSAGDVAWIKPAIAYAHKHSITDPREVTAICLCGRHDLLNNEFQAKLEKCTMPTGE